MHNLFIYGTLKRGYPNHDEYLAKEKYVGECRTVEKYPLIIANKWFAPVMLHEPGKGKNIKGELYQVNGTTLSALDSLEHTHEARGYKRLLIEIQNIENNRIVLAYSYFKKRQHVKDIVSEHLTEYTDQRYIPIARRTTQE